ncbi:hypothetical protein BGZ97_006096 [Linnemannia gamsii]|uniref:SET domain-containing protein n=1 Tax=Linnemannia gamsii TaxID=64522 RepID=A0A9P6RC50_9FUNG|nr:hypothetical protein BGZ97_006096 [Linnemannia gamsii]
MEHINTVCRNEGYPIAVENSPQLGNHAIASRDIPQGEGLLRAIPYAAEVFDNYKKRMCQVCLLYHNRGSFSHRCQDCDQVYFCSLACKSVAMDPLVGCHLKVCRTLRKLATWNSDRHTKSIIKLLIQVLMGHWRERQGFLTAYQSRRALERQQQHQQEREREQMDKDDGDEDLKGQEQEKEGATEVDGSSAAAVTKLLETTIISSSTTPTPPTSQLPQPSQPSSSSSSSAAQDQDQNQDQNWIQEPVENDFYDVLRLQSHFEDWDDEDQKDWNKQSHIVLSLLEMAGLTEMASTPGGPLHTLTSLDVKRLISALESNAFGMFDRTKKKPVCFGRAVQADGSTEEITGDAVLGLIEQEDISKKEAVPSSVSSLSTSGSMSSLTETTESESGTGTSTPAESGSGTATPAEVEEGGSETTTPVAAAAAAAVADPYDSRVGEFRMMTFFSICEIPKGKDITISYIDTEMPLQARRLALLSDYHFHCCCERCLREEKSGAPKVAKSTKKKGIQPKTKAKRK